MRATIEIRCNSTEPENYSLWINGDEKLIGLSKEKAEFHKANAEKQRAKFERKKLIRSKW